MLVEIRIYRRHDADLIMLKAYGINISKMMRLALENYVNGTRLKLRLPDSRECDISNCSMLRYRLNISNSKVESLLKSIKRGYRNQFCKALLRDMMDEMALGVYLDTESAIQYESNRIEKDAFVAQTDMHLFTNSEMINLENVNQKRKTLSSQEEQKMIQKNDIESTEENDKIQLVFQKPQKSKAKETISANESNQSNGEETSRSEKSLENTNDRTASLLSTFQNMMEEF